MPGQPLRSELIAPAAACARRDPRAGSIAAASGEAVSADVATVARLTAAGFSVRQTSMRDRTLRVSRASAPGAALTAAQVEALVASAGDIVDLNLRNAGIDDTLLAALERLTHLYLDHNDVSNAGLEALASLADLEYLNLVGNAAITDAAAAPLSRLQRLARLYVWNSSMTASGIDELMRRRPALLVESGVAAPASADPP